MHHFIEQTSSRGWLTRVDPRVKVIAALALLIMTITYNGFEFPLIVALLGLALCMQMQVSAKVIALRFAEPLFIAAVIILIKMFFTGSAEIFSISLAGISIKASSDGLGSGLLTASRIIGAVSVVAAVSLSTRFNEIIAALSWMKMPKTFIEVLIFAYRYIFMLYEEAMVIYNAQKNRLGYSGFRSSMNSCGTMAGSLILRAFEHSHNTAVAMQQRGYNGSLPMPQQKRFSRVEVFVSFIFITAMGIIWTSL